MSTPSTLSSTRAIRTWILAICLLVLGMVVIGGITRLTGSGLSIVDWAPIMGAIPPLSDYSWNEVFNAYRQSPQGKLVNAGMTLEQFKSIYFWEYLHRLLGRLLGMVFFVPWLVFVVRGKLRGRLALRLLGGFALGGMQGLLGWLMVKSGLVDNPYVSHYRLAAHLGLALLVLVYLHRIYLDLGATPPAAGVTRGFRRELRIFTGLVGLQIIFGAFVSGLKAGHAYPTFPKMHGQWLPDEAWRLSPTWLNLVENPAMVQFVHRTIGWTIFANALAFAVVARRRLPPASARPVQVLLGMVGVQFALGVSTLLFMVPLPIAVLHQLLGTLTWTACFWALHRWRAPTPT